MCSRRFLSSLTIIFLSASCTTMYERPAQSDREPISEGTTDENEVREKKEPKPQRPVVRSSKSQKTSPTNPAVNQLLSQARLAAKEEDLERAISFSERAYRIDHRDPRVSLTMAELLMNDGRPGQAEQWALKAVRLFSPKERQGVRRAWSIVAESRTAKGDYEGAREAKAKVDEY